MENLPVNSRSNVDRLIVCLATGLHISSLPTTIVNRFKDSARGQALIEKKWTGAGLLGSLEGAFTYAVLPTRFANAWWLIALGVVFSVYVSGRAEKILNSHDDSRIVIDEWVGAWVALWGLGHHRIPALVLAVLLFRIFDVLKGPIGRQLQLLPGGWGVTFDDVYAGFAANIFWRIAVLFLPSSF